MSDLLLIGGIAAVGALIGLLTHKSQRRVSAHREGKLVWVLAWACFWPVLVPVIAWDQLRKLWRSR